MPESAARSLFTRADLVEWLKELLPDPYDYPTVSGSTYTEPIRRLEWAVRPLWAVFSLMAGGEGAGANANEAQIVEPYLNRIRDGLTPGPLAFPDPTLKDRQIVIEQEVFGFGLLVCGKQLLSALSDAQVERLVTWLGACNGVELPWGSWLASRALINAGLAAAGLPYDASRLELDLRSLDSMYSGGGWYENGRPYQRDYYIPLAFQSIVLLISRFAPQLRGLLTDVEDREAAFEDDFVCWFDRQGRSVPFGRSLFYRFGHAAFWAAAALTGTHRRPLGQIKCLLMQNLRWWHEHMVGGLVPGYTYPLGQLAENYCAPGSPLRALRALVVLALPADHEFWAVEEEEPERPALRAEPVPGMLAVCGPHHSCLFSAMQYGGPTIALGASKYGKLCYSSAFGWNIPRDLRGVANFAVDSCLALSIAGLDQYVSRERSDVGEVAAGYVHSSWRMGDVARVETWVLPLSEVAHVRVHRIEAFTALDTCEGAFPIFEWNPKVNEPEESGDARILLSRVNEAGRRWRSGILDAAVEDARVMDALAAAGLDYVAESAQWCHRVSDVVLQDPNTNIYSFERSAVPVLRGRIEAGTTWFGTLVIGEPGV